MVAVRMTSFLLHFALLHSFFQLAHCFVVPVPRNLFQSNRALKSTQIYSKKTIPTYSVTTREELDAYWEDREGRFRDAKGNINYDLLINSVNVIGDTQIIGSKDHPERIHPVLKLMHERRRNNSLCTEGPRPDGFKIALAVEGGGMRGCLSAGMVAAIYYLGLEETVDVVYGSSAGTVIGSYFITRQLQWFGHEIYYDALTTAGKQFIDGGRLLRTLGLGLLNPRLFRDVITRPRFGKPVLNLDFLLKTTVQENKPLEWERFVKMQKKQPMNVVVSSLQEGKTVALNLENGDFESLEDLANCMHASCLLPGIAGPVMNRNKSPGMSGDFRKMMLGNNLDPERYEPMADALLYQPIPYHSAIENGATHVVVLRTRPDGADVTGKSSIFERLIFRRFFVRKNNLDNIFRHVRKHLHKKKYAESVLELNHGAWDERDYTDTSKPHLLTIAVPPGSPEVPRLETGREAIFEGVRRGFARAYDALVEDPTKRGRGSIVAKQYFPDEILDYDPLTIKSTKESAFEIHLKQIGEDPESWKVSGVQRSGAKQ